ncbi:MAG: TonB-dependent receptor [Anaeromyxobacter sp.]
MASCFATLLPSGRPRAVRAWALASLLLPGGPALAQEAGAAPTQPPAQAPAQPAGAPAPAHPAPEQPAPDAPSFTMDEAVVRTPRGEVAEAPASATTVVEADTFQGELRDVGSLLVHAPGVEVQRFGTRGQASTVAIRGVSADSVKVLVDGLPLGGVGGTVDLSTIPRGWISRLEVVRGPAGAAFGAGAVGGAVNVVTRPPAGDAIAAELAGGTMATWSASVDGSTRLGGYAALASATAEGTSGEFPYAYDVGDVHQERTRQNNGALRGGVLLKLGGPAGPLRLDTLLQASGGHRELAGTVTHPTPQAWQDDGRLLGMVRLSGSPADALTLSGRLHARADLLDVQHGSEDPTEQRGGAAGLQLEGDLVHAGGTLALIASGEGEGYRGTSLGGTRSRGTFAASLSEDWRVARPLRLAPALRFERTGPYAGWSATLGAALQLPLDLTLRASASRTFRVPSFAELYLEQGGLQPNPDLRPASGLGADAALVHDGALGLLSAGAFALREDDTITYEPASADSWKPFNTAATLTAGVELEAASAEVRRLADLTLSAAYTFLHSEVLEGPIDVVGNALPRRPRHALLLRAAVTPGRFEAHAEGRWVRDQYRDERNEAPVPDQTTFGAGVSWRVLDRPRLSVHLQVDNLTDDRSLQDGFGNPLPGRTALLSLRVGSTQAGPPPAPAP